MGAPTVAARTADPYGDADVIDARAPRFNQATVGIVSVIALATGWWWLFGLLAAQLILGLTRGRKYCLPCVFYFEVVQPRLGEGEIEDARPPRFANILGAVCLSVATLAHALGLGVVGQVLGGLVAALALVAAATGLCVGCELYRLLARVRGVRPGGVALLDLRGLDAPSAQVGELLVHFTHPLCGACSTVEQRLRADGRPLLSIDVAERPDLARRYHITVVPTAFAVDGDGAVLQRLV
jgi:uncharacterized protein DUF4395